MNFEKYVIKNSQNKKDENKNNMPFYLMTLEDNNGECKQIKIYQNSDPFELSYNFCKENNLDFESMKYVKKNIKEIVKKFNEDKDFTMIEEEECYEDEDEDENKAKKIINFREGKKNKNKKSTKELVCSLIKKNIKLNHSKINKIAPLQKKINEDIQKICKLKKNELFDEPDYSKKSNKKESFKKNNYRLVKNKNIYKVNKTIGANELKNNRCILGEKNWSNDNIKINTFSYQNNSCEYGVPELNKNNSINMIKKIEKFSKNNEINIKPIEENEEIESSKRKFENEDDNEEDKSSSKGDIKKEIIDLKASNNKEKVRKYTCFNFNKMINNINNNNYNHNYHFNTNNSININNNNISNNINPINFNGEYQFNYISSKDSMEDIINSKSLEKMKNLSNRPTRLILNDKLKDIISFNSKANLMNICKRIKINKKKKILFQLIIAKVQRRNILKK